MTQLQCNLSGTHLVVTLNSSHSLLATNKIFDRLTAQLWAHMTYNAFDIASRSGFGVSKPYFIHLSFTSTKLAADAKAWVEEKFELDSANG